MGWVWGEICMNLADLGWASFRSKTGQNIAELEYNEINIFISKTKLEPFEIKIHRGRTHFFLVFFSFFRFFIRQPQIGGFKKWKVQIKDISSFWKNIGVVTWYTCIVVRALLCITDKSQNLKNFDQPITWKIS